MARAISFPIARGISRAIASPTPLGRAGVGATPVVTATAAWSSVYKNANITLSNGSLSATTAGSSAHSGVRAIVGKSAGKFYHEVNVAANGGASVTVGIGNVNAALNGFVGSNLNGVGWIAGGNYYINSVGTLIASWAVGDTLCVAVDFDASKIYFRKNGGNWNNSGAANPVTGVGGISIAGLNAGPYFPMVSLYFLNDALAANFGATAYAQAPPSGFGNWSFTVATGINYVAEGDSISSTGLTSGPTYPQLYAGYRPSATETTQAVSGNKLADLISRASATDALKIAGRRNVLTVLLGNDIVDNYAAYGGGRASYVAAVATYLDARRAAGWKVVLCSTLPRTDGSTSSRVGFNIDRNLCNTTTAGWVGLHCDYYVDFGNDPTMGPDAAPADSSLYYDGTHPTAVGSANLRNIITSTLDGL